MPLLRSAVLRCDGCRVLEISEVGTMQATAQRERVTRRASTGDGGRAAKGLDRHDAAATGLGLLAATVVWATLDNGGWLFIESYRGAIGVLTLIGIGMCAVGARITPETKTGPFLATAYVLGAAAGVLAIAGLIVGSEEMFVALAIDIAVLWIVATTRHALGRN
jgi:hypothetical protein